MVNYKYKCVACAFTGTVPTWELNRNFPKTKTFERYHKREKLKQIYKDVPFPHSEISQNGIFSAKRR